ncbi:MAG: T9SS type A sorting domain-containing protein [Flavobacteriales bacterium]|nr:T9SS type A sorting domain-containing protein [Flavobacteriales bacterium]
MKNFLVLIAFTGLTTLAAAQLRSEIHPYPKSSSSGFLKTQGGGVFCETFDDYLSTNLPSGWVSNSLSPNGGYTMQTAATVNSGSWNIDPSGQFLITNDDLCNCDASQELIETPSIDLSGYNNVYLSFDYWHDARFGGEASVHMSVNGGNWDTLAILDADESWQHIIVDINSAWNQNVKFRFGWTDQGGWATGFAIDNIKVDSLTNGFIPLNQGWLSNGKAEYSKIPLIQFSPDLYKPYIFMLNQGPNNDQVKGLLSINSQTSLAEKTIASLGSDSLFFNSGLLGNALYQLNFSNNSNTQTAQKEFEITHLEFALDKDLPEGKIGSGLGCKYETGNSFEIVQSGFVDGVKFHIGNGTSVGTTLYSKFFRINGSGGLDSLTQSTDYTLTQTDIDNGWVTINFTNPMAISAGERYVAAIGFPSTAGLLFVDYSGKQKGLSYYRSYSDCSGAGVWQTIDRNPMIRLMLKDDCVGLNVKVSNLEKPICSDDQDGKIDLMISGGQAPITYLWSNGSTDQNQSNLNSGIYDVTVTEGSGCSLAIIDIDLQIQDSVQVTELINTASVCGDDGALEVKASGNRLPFTYAWNVDGQAIYGNQVSGLHPGYHVVTITDGLQCNWSDSFQITGVLPLNILDSTIHSSCNSGNGGVWLNVSGGLGNYAYSWSNGSTSDSTGSVGSGVYNVTITHGACSNTVDFMVADSGAAFLSASKTNVLCNGDATGSIDLSIDSGGVGPFDFNWSSSQTTEDISSLGTGNYVVTVMDANNCTSFLETWINEPSVISWDTINIELPSCPGDSNGLVSIGYSGGSGVLSLLWNNTADSNYIANLAAGNYAFTISDINSCSVSNSITLADPLPLSITLSIDSEQVGNIDVTVNGGTAPYNFLWNTGNIGEDLRLINQKGEYIVMVTDLNGCSTSDTIQLQGNVNISDFNSESLNLFLFPNPASNEIWLRTSSQNSIMYLYDMFGRTIRTENLSSDTKKMSIEDLKVGVYLVKICSTGCVTGSFIKK